MPILRATHKTNPATRPTRSHFTKVLATAGVGVVVAVTLGLATVRAEAPLREYQIKAAFVSKFLRFVEWAPAAGSHASRPLAVCAFGDGSIDEAFESLEAEHVEGRAIAYRHVDTAQDTAACDVLFFPDTHEARLPEVLAALDSAPVLTIGENHAVHGGGWHHRVRVSEEPAQVRDQPGCGHTVRDEDSLPAAHPRGGRQAGRARGVGQ